jgi:hypothetical protein
VNSGSLTIMKKNEKITPKMTAIMEIQKLLKK